MRESEIDQDLHTQLRQMQDVDAVRQLMYRYHQACDGWGELGTHRDPGAIADLFTDDGQWDVTAQDPPPTGRDEIIALARRLQSVPWIVHYVANPIVDVDGDRGMGRFVGVLRVRPAADARRVWSLGIYELAAERTSRGWRIQRLSWEPVEPAMRFAPPG
jgi:hypothetical protein